MLLMALTGLGLLTAALGTVPWAGELRQLGDEPQWSPLRTSLASVLPVRPAGLEGIDQGDLMERLAAADAAWTPRTEQLPDGRTRYHYRRRSHEPPLSLGQIRDLIANPPSFERERQAISQLVDVLGRAGVRIQVREPLRAGAAGEWDPRARTLRIKSTALNQGSAEFAKVLNHEAIHVAQSCHNGHLRATPRPLGLNDRVPPELSSVFGESVYRQAGQLELRLEREAYANQHRLDLGRDLVRRHCRLADTAPAPREISSGERGRQQRGWWWE